MIVNRAYYLLKPLMPWRFRLSLRRVRASYLRKAYADVWPIDEKAGTIPPNWPGWPQGKQFALVLTHDVEGQKGLSRVEQLMAVERKRGLRSSFNLVPEGEYRVSDSLRNAITVAGFEVGIHGLEHDGKLYASKARFAAKASRIREYMRLWNASGFRSPLMQHKLSWLHRLEAEYDASTFDTDPFEPEPDGVRTIFPFWVPRPDGGGYVELPYTLVQDFTLFQVLCESTIDLWKRKLDWVAERGGMALINTHPDYMCFEGKPARGEYPVSRYEEFLSYVTEKYEGKFWAALPREVARYYCASLPADARNTRKKICMVAYSPYVRDNRIRRYAETLARRGDMVDMIGLTDSGGQPRGIEQMNGVSVHKIQRRAANERMKWRYAWGVLRFLFSASLTLRRLHRRNGYDMIHVHNMPDFLVFAAWYPKLTGAKIILDIHDIMPELFVSKFKAQGSDPLVSSLKLIEKLSVSFVDHVIISNDLWYDKLVARSVPRERCSILVNHVDSAVFYQRARARNDGKLIVIFPGSFQWHQGLDIAIEAFVRVREKLPHAELHLYGGSGGNEGEELARLAERLGLGESVKFHAGVSLDQVPDLIANADLGIVPKRADSFGNEAYSTKIMEFMSQGVPVVVSRTKIDSFYFDENDVHFFASGDPGAMADAMLEVIGDDRLRERLIARGYEYVKRNGWDRKKKTYLDLVDLLSTEAFGDTTPLARAAVESGQ